MKCQEWQYDLTICMPCYNEELVIARAIEMAQRFQAESPLKIQILIVDNNSKDASVKIAKSLGCEVVTEHRQGYGYALQCGIRHARGKYTIIADCDGTYDVYHLQEFVQYLQEGTDLVMGNRFFVKPDSKAICFSHRIGVRILSWIGRKVGNCNVRDFHCGLRGFQTTLAQSLVFTCGGMEFASEMILRFVQVEAKIQEVPVTLLPGDIKRESHLRTIRDGMRHLLLLITWYFKNERSFRR